MEKYTFDPDGDVILFMTHPSLTIEKSENHHSTIFISQAKEEAAKGMHDARDICL